MNHVMIDIETLGTSTDAPLAAIGAVFFEPSTGCTGARFYIRVDFANDMLNGAKPDAETIKWWLKQPSEARAELLSDESVSIWEAMSAFSDFLAENAIPDDPDQLIVWGNSPSFDCAILRAAFIRADNDATPWKYWNERDVRTLVDLGRVAGIDPKHTTPFEGSRHHALDDAFHQATYVSEIWQRLTTPIDDVI